jgi:hypothetical protein
MTDGDDRTADGDQTRLRVLAAGGFAIVLSMAGMLAVVAAIDAGAVPVDWVLYALPTFGLLGFLGLGTMVTALAARDGA